MANILRHAVIGCGLAGALVVGAVAPSSAQGVYANPCLLYTSDAADE